MAIHIAACGAEMGLKTLLVDMDGQCNSTLLVTNKMKISEGFSVIDLWDDDSEMSFRKYDRFDFFMLPGNESASALQGGMNRDAMVSASRAMNRLRESSFDLVVFDAPPAAGVLQLGPMMLGGTLIVPVTPDPMTVQGLVSAIRYHDMINKQNIALDMRIMINRYKQSSNNQTRIIEMLRKTNYKDYIVPEMFTDRVLAPDALKSGKPVWQYAPRDPGAGVWRRVCERFIEETKESIEKDENPSDSIEIMEMDDDENS